MVIWKLFSQRQEEAARSGDEDIYQYENIPQPLRVQVAQIGLEALGDPIKSRGYYDGDDENPAWNRIDRLFRRERGIVSLGPGGCPGDQVINYMSRCDTRDWLDILELMCVCVSVHTNDYKHRGSWGISSQAETVLEEVNYRLMKALVGYRFEDGMLIRVDSQFVHSEIVKPALGLIAGKQFEGAREEFRVAHQHYREGENRQAVSMAANALESTLKAVFDQKRWQYAKGARISDLMKVAKANKLWPDYLDNSFDQLVATLQSGLPKIRDNDASHGAGSVPKNVPSYIAAYALHLAASKIVFIVEAAKSS